MIVDLGVAGVNTISEATESLTRSGKFKNPVKRHTMD